jgi:hypothetical protein
MMLTSGSNPHMTTHPDLTPPPNSSFQTYQPIHTGGTLSESAFWQEATELVRDLRKLVAALMPDEPDASYLMVMADYEELRHKIASVIGAKIPAEE